jgi:SAM-dependent methyltransferase
MRYIFYTSKPVDEKWDDTWGADDIQRHLDTIKRFPQLLRLFQKHLRPGARILEAGCGMGRWVIHLNRLGHEVVGIDYSESAIRSIGEYDKALRIDLGDVMELPYDDDSFDAYLSFGVIEHVDENRDRILKEAHRILRPGGVIIVSVPLLNNVARMLWFANKVIFGFKVDKHYFEEAMSEETLGRMLRANDFEVIDAASYGHFTTLYTLLPFLRRGVRREGAHPGEFNTLGEKINDFITEIPDSTLISRQLAHMITCVGRSKKA